jgi:DNA ligase-1
MITIITEDMITTAYETPVLEKFNIKGIKTYWQGVVVTDGDHFYTTTRRWQLTEAGENSKVTESRRAVVFGKVEGSQYEQSTLEHATKEIMAKMKKKRAAAYVEQGEVYSGHPLPMLAQRYRDCSSDIKYPCYVQPKLDGQRASTNGSVFWSRVGNENIPEVVSHLLFDTNGLNIDGELILPLPFTFDDTETALKKYRSADEPEKGNECEEHFHSSMIEYHIFDVMDASMLFEDRLAWLRDIESGLPNQVKLVPTYLVNNEDEAIEKYDEFIKLGYEGIMFRNSDGLYKGGYRSRDLQKLKPSEDEEFVVVDITDGRGSEQGAAIYICETANGKRFNCRPVGSIASRRIVMHDKKQYIGKKLTVKYQRLSADGIPIFARGIGFKSDR